MSDRIKKAVEILNDGGIVIFPTDTAFGIGCKMDNPVSVKRLFDIRRRPENQAVPVLVDSIGMAEKFLHSPLPNNVRHLMKDFWPGALTVVSRCNENLVTPLVRGNGKNLGVRMPDHVTLLELIKKIGVPLLGPSANFHGNPTPYKFADLDPDLVRQVDFVIPGDSKGNKASTVLDVSSLPWKILRKGSAVVDVKIYQNGI